MSRIIIGPESEQKDLENFNKKINHLNEDGSVSYKPEGVENAEIIYENKDVCIKKIGNYHFIERNNIDSIAFVLFANNIDEDRRLGLSYEYQPGIDKPILKAFTASIKNKEIVDLRDLVIDEVKTQCGYEISKDDIQYLGKNFVSSKMNEYCHLFGIRVNKFVQELVENNHPRKKDSGQYWALMEEIVDLEDWKAQIIIYKRFILKQSQLVIKKQ